MADQSFVHKVFGNGFKIDPSLLGSAAAQNLSNAMNLAQQYQQTAQYAQAQQQLDYAKLLEEKMRQMSYTEADEIIRRKGTKFVKEVEQDPMEAAIQRATEIMKQGG